ncbi:MAG: hypothetical protein VB025_06185 [Sphaerochaeta sp.]|nr:hypothetical protein [Sphaerochaeta sp.]
MKRLIVITLLSVFVFVVFADTAQVELRATVDDINSGGNGQIIKITEPLAK